MYSNHCSEQPISGVWNHTALQIHSTLWTIPGSSKLCYQGTLAHTAVWRTAGLHTTEYELRTCRIGHKMDCAQNENSAVVYHRELCWVISLWLYFLVIFSIYA
ncbi:uncharacterized protein LOC143216971 [Lasioglossum baleicum]|uniref:uncharacterized protein LOC143216971 n=1 Tax=Lasioglossum baleicum TaxID=434251 RepID=UPI003FCE98D8